MRSTRQKYGWGALLIAVIGCSGGQTGQPTAGSCEGRSAAPDERLRGVTPDEFAASFEGEHVVTLRWHGPAALADDVLTAELQRSAPLGATTDCGEEGLSVGVEVEVRTRDYGALAATSAVMQGATGQRERAKLTFQSSRARLDADLIVVDGEVQLSGVLTTSDAQLPATTATFPAPEATGGAGGGAGAGGG